MIKPLSRDDQIALDMGLEALEEYANGDLEAIDAAEEFVGYAAFGILQDMEVV